LDWAIEEALDKFVRSEICGGIQTAGGTKSPGHHSSICLRKNGGTRVGLELNLKVLEDRETKPWSSQGVVKELGGGSKGDGGQEDNWNSRKDR